MKNENPKSTIHNPKPKIFNSNIFCDKKFYKMTQRTKCQLFLAILLKFLSSKFEFIKRFDIVT